MHRGNALIVGGLYPGLGLAAACFHARSGKNISIIHRTNTARPNEDISKVEKKILSHFDVHRWPLIVRRVNDECELSVKNAIEEVIKINGPVNSFLFAQGARAYPLEDIVPLNTLRHACLREDNSTGWHRNQANAAQGTKAHQRALHPPSSSCSSSSTSI